VIPTPPIPLPRDAVKVWTGHSLLVWGGGRRGADSNRTGAVYVPATNRWHLIRSAPIGLNAATGLWTGSQMIVLGALLDRDNNAATRTAIGAVYDSRADTWRRLAPSSLAPQATSAALMGDQLVAWDYVGHSQQYSLASDRWSPASQTPFGFGECQPQTLATQTTMFAFFCGHAATVDPEAGGWTTLSGGVTAPTVKLADRRVPKFQTASLTAVGGSVAIAATGLVLDNGTPCFGCQGAPVSYWLYRPHP
jgi:hypothetical protein